MGPGDHHCHEGQATIATLKKRDRHDFITVTVKLDGSCMAVARIDGVIVPLSRSGYLATTSKYEQHQLFAQWVYANQNRFLGVLRDGERMVGEWMAQAHGTRYKLFHEPFVPFDVMTATGRIPVSETIDRVSRAELVSPFAISLTGEPMNLDSALEVLKVPRHGEIDPVEGAVWRVERRGEFDFICKWVRSEKIDGKYLPEVSGAEPVWNWRPDLK
jgi:hypothetical protein